LILTRKIALFSALALSVIAPVVMEGCDSTSPTATVVTSAPTPQQTVEGTVPEAVGTGTAPEAIPSVAPTVAPK
jgi:hypothetical protein